MIARCVSAAQPIRSSPDTISTSGAWPFPPSVRLATSSDVAKTPMPSAMASALLPKRAAARMAAAAHKRGTA